MSGSVNNMGERWEGGITGVALALKCRRKELSAQHLKLAQKLPLLAYTPTHLSQTRSNLKCEEEKSEENKPPQQKRKHRKNCETALTPGIPIYTSIQVVYKYSRIVKFGRTCEIWPKL